VNITPALPNPYQLPVDQDKGAVAAVRAPNRARDSADQAGRRELRPQHIDETERERLVAQTNILLDRPPHAASARASRALASYAEVAESGDPGGLRELLGFDAYA